MLDPAALERRQFALADVGVMCKILSVEKSTKIAKSIDGFDGGQSSSRLVEIVGMHRTRVGTNAVQREPFVVAKVSPFEETSGEPDTAKLEDIKLLFSQLSDLRKGMEIEGADDWDRPLEERVEIVSALGGQGVSLVLAATSLLDGKVRITASILLVPQPNSLPLRDSRARCTAGVDFGPMPQPRLMTTTLTRTRPRLCR